MIKLYDIVLNNGYNQKDLYSYVTRVVDELPNRPHYFIAECTAEQIEILKEHEAVMHCNCKEDEPEIENAVVKQVDYRRDYNHIQMAGSGVQRGNWGLIRHTSQTNNTTFNTDSSGTYSNLFDGSGVDIILQIGSLLDRADPEFKTSGTTRLQTFQWNTLTGMSSLPTIDYAVHAPVESHAEAVAYITAGNTYGWATGAQLYIWPRNLMTGTGWGLNTHGWDCFKLFHQNKGNSRPTIVVDAIQYNFGVPVIGGLISFRDDIYSQVAPSGSPTVAAERIRVINANGTHAFGNGYYPRSHGTYSLLSNLPSSNMDARNLSDQDKNDIKVYIENLSHGTNYYTHHLPIEEMTAAGVHHVSAAGNYNNKIALSDNIDYNNGVITLMSLIIGSGAGEYYRPWVFYPLHRPDLHQQGDTIVCASLGSQFSVDSNLNNKETMSEFSNRGDRVDTCAAGENIYMTLYTNGSYEASGTSFASPNVGGMAACVLGRYPTTTPAQLRKYFREHAVGTDTLYDTGTQPAASSNIGDAPYFEDALGLKGYSGNIAYLDPLIAFDPRTISDTSITSTETVSSNNKVNFTVSQINMKLSNIT